MARLRLPSESIPDAIISIYGIHLEGENNTHQEQIDLIASLKRTLWDDESDLILLVGDFNFALAHVEDVDSDTHRSQLHLRLAKEFSEALPQFVAVSPHGFPDLSCCHASVMLPMLLRRASLSYRHSTEMLDESNEELCLYYASRCLRCVVKGDLPAAFLILHKAPHWRLRALSAAELLPRLVQLVRMLRLRVWTARSKDMYDSCVGGGGLDDARANKRAKVQRWAGILAAWRCAYKQCSFRGLMVDQVPVVETASIAAELTRAWSPTFEALPSTPVQHALDAFLEHAPEVLWPPQPLVDEDEVIKLLARCPASAPGPDGVHYAHLACLGRPLARHLAELANQWFEHGIWSDAFRHSHLVAIPKTKAEEPWTAAASRPISLANTSDKILMRILANALCRALSSVIVKTQYGFLSGRQIAECILQFEASCLELAPTHPGAAAVFLDIRRAFDSLDLGFLFALLHKTHAPEWLLRCLRACYRDNTMSFLVNGVEGPVMQSKKGLRQGCPASAILFVFCLDPLHRWLERAIHPAPSVFGYADDLALVLADTSGSQGAGVSRFLELLPLATSMQINFAKTVVMPLHRDGVGRTIDSMILHLPDWRMASESLCVRYLGVLLGHDAHASRFRTIIEKMEDRIARIDLMRIGMPAAWGLARAVVWAVV